MEKNIIPVGLRLNENVNEKLKRKAEEIGISKNALILTLIDIGLKTYEGRTKDIKG